MGHDLVSRVKDSIPVLVSLEGLFGVFDKVADPEGVSDGVPYGQSRRGNPVVSKVVPREGIPVSNSKPGHLDADQKVLDGGGEVVGGIALHIVGEGAEPDQDGQEEALPVRGEEDELDAQKLGHRPERLQVVVRADPEQPERVQADGDADVVDEPAPEITRVEADIPLLVCVGRLHDDCRQGEEGLQPRILQDAALDGEEGVGVGYVDAGKDVVQRPQVMDGFATICHDDEGSFTAEVVDQQLEKRVYCECLEM